MCVGALAVHWHGAQVNEILKEDVARLQVSLLTCRVFNFERRMVRALL